MILCASILNEVWLCIECGGCGYVLDVVGVVMWWVWLCGECGYVVGVAMY